MKKIFLFLLCFLFLIACQPQVSQQDHMKIVVASDIHYFLKDYYQDCEWFEESMLYGDGKMVTYADEIMDAFIEKMTIMHPDIIVLTGDLSFNGEKGSHKGLASLLMKLENEGIKVAVIPGNHDVDNIFAKGYGKDDYFDVEKTNAKDFKEIYRHLGYDLAVSQHQDSLSYTLSLNDDFSLIMLDSTAHELTGSIIDIGGYLTDSTMSWLENELKNIQQQKKIPLIAMHHNLAIHNELLHQTYTIQNNESIADLFSQYHVPFVLSGHIHCQNIKEIKGIYDIATSSLLDAPLQYGVIDLTKEKMTYHCESLNISIDANDYFDTVSRNKISQKMEESEDNHLKQDVFVQMNRYYFAGTIALHKEEIKQMPGYAMLLKEEGFYTQYVQSMMKEDNDSTQLDIDFTKEVEK